MERVCLAIVVGALGGLSSSVFLYALDFVTTVRLLHPKIIYALPLAGLAIGIMTRRLGGGGASLVVEQIHSPKDILPRTLAPVVLVGTLLTHLFGGSAGREGTAVQMGAALADQLNHVWRQTVERRKALLMAGMAAGFSSAVGAPIAGAVFGLEVMKIKNGDRLKVALECALASVVGYTLTLLLRAPHSAYPQNVIPEPNPKLLLLVGVAGLMFGQGARVFLWTTYALEKIVHKQIRLSAYRPLVGGLALIGLYLIFGERYAGLGIGVIQSALESPATWWDGPFKILLTAVTLASGFKGGEFIPLVFVGTTLGSAFGIWADPDSFTVFAAAGFGAVFGATAKTPIATAIMTAEIFGARILPFSLLAGWIAAATSGEHRIYGRLPPPRS